MPKAPADITPVVVLALGALGRTSNTIKYVLTAAKSRKIAQTSHGGLHELVCLHLRMR